MHHLSRLVLKFGRQSGSPGGQLVEKVTNFHFYHFFGCGSVSKDVGPPMVGVELGEVNFTQFSATSVI